MYNQHTLETSWPLQVGPLQVIAIAPVVYRVDCCYDGELREHRPD